MQLKYILTIVCTALLFCAEIGYAQDAREIVAKADEKQRGVETAQSDMTITIVRPRWSREMSLKTWSKGNEYSMILITSPAKEKGIVFLKRGKEVWNWVPSIERTIKLPPSMMMQNWMGTDFTNDDLVRESSIVNDYTHRLAGDSTILGRSCYKIELIPKPDAPVVWGRIVTFIDKADFIQLRAEMYDEDNYLVNIMNSSVVKELGGQMLATRSELIPVDKEGQKTVMEINAIEFDEPIEEEFFTTQRMKKVR